MKKNKNYTNVNSRWRSFIKPLYTLFVIAVPAILIWIFFSKDVFAVELGINFIWWIKFAIALAFIVVTSLITALMVYLKIIDISVFMFSLPVSICLMTIFLTDNFTGDQSWVRAIIIIPVFFLTIPICITIKKIEIRLAIKKRTKEKIDNEKIIGYKDKK